MIWIDMPLDLSRSVSSFCGFAEPVSDNYANTRSIAVATRLLSQGAGPRSVAEEIRLAGPPVTATDLYLLYLPTHVRFGSGTPSRAIEWQLRVETRHSALGVEQREADIALDRLAFETTCQSAPTPARAKQRRVDSEAKSEQRDRGGNERN